MTDEEITTAAADVFASLQILESRFPDSRAVKLLHEKLFRAFERLIADKPGVVRPYDGTNKPPPGP